MFIRSQDGMSFVKMEDVEEIEARTDRGRENRVYAVMKSGREYLIGKYFDPEQLRRAMDTLEEKYEMTGDQVLYENTVLRMMEE